MAFNSIIDSAELHALRECAMKNRQFDADGEPCWCHLTGSSSQSGLHTSLCHSLRRQFNVGESNDE